MTRPDIWTPARSHRAVSRRDLLRAMGRGGAALAAPPERVYLFDAGTGERLR